MAINEPVGVIGIICPDNTPFLAMISLMAPAIARGNTVILNPSRKYPLLATDLYQVLETSDIPAGVVNIVTGMEEPIGKTLCEHQVVSIAILANVNYVVCVVCVHNPYP